MAQTHSATPSSVANRNLLWLCRTLTWLSLGAAAAYYIAVSLHWRIMVDSAVMHYVVFLMRHGRAPYTQISDNNMPGAYFVEALGMVIFGRSDVGWRLFEFTTLAVLTMGLVDIARRWDASAGVLAAGLFTVLHSAEGPPYAAERELVITTLLVLAFALLFRATERPRSWLFLLFGLACGLAASIKPTCVLLFAVALGLSCLRLHRQRIPFMPALLSALGGLLFCFGLDVAFLLHFHAIDAFLFILRHVIPAYVGLGTPMSMRQLLVLSLPRIVLPAAAAALVLACTHLRGESSLRWQRGLLLLGAFYGLFSFIIQRKGYLHHRYTLEIFVFLLLGLELFGALQRADWTRWLAGGVLLYLLFFVVPHTLRITAQNVDGSDLESALEGDLEQLGGAATLQNNVQCFDLVYGCLSALYHLQVVENGSFTGDLLFFPERSTEATAYYRQRFWGVVKQKPPDVVVVTNQNLSSLNDFGKLNRWPAFDEWLQQGYVPAVERHFTYEHFGGRFQDPVLPVEQDAYRIFVRKGSPEEAMTGGLRNRRYPGQS